MADPNGSMNGSGSAQGGGDASGAPYAKTSMPSQPGGNVGMVSDTGGNVISDPVEDPNTYTPTRYPKDPYGGPSGIPIHTPPGDPGAGQSAGLPPTFPPAQPTGGAAAGPTPYDLYLSRGGRPLTDAQQAAAAQAQRALGADYSHLSNPYANIASAIQAGNTPQQIAAAVQNSRGGYSPYDLSASHSGGAEAFNALRGAPMLGIYDNGTPQQVAAWRARVENNPLMAIPNRMRGSNLSVPNGGAPGEDIPNRPGTPGTGTTETPRGPGGRSATVPWDPNGGMQVGPGGTTGAGDPGRPAGFTPSTAGAGPAQGTPASATPGGRTGTPGWGGGTSYGPGGTTGAGDPATPTTTPRTGGGGGGYRPGGGQDVPETSSTAGGGGGYGYEETTTKKWSPSGGGGGGGRGGSAQRPAAQYPWRGGQLS